jgi:hypothetical protein
MLHDGALLLGYQFGSDTMVELPGRELARELLEKSRALARQSPMEEVIEAAREGRLDDDRMFRLIGRLWSLERLFYYIYGGWGQGLELNDFPPGVKYLFARQVLDESTHEMAYVDTMLRKGWLEKQRDAFSHPYSRFVMDSSLASFAFSMRYLATYAHPVRIAALNLGAKVIELGWMEGLVAELQDPMIRGVFESQFVENRSHIQMGRRVVEECVKRPLDAELCRRGCDSAGKDYIKFLNELAAFVLDREVDKGAAGPRTLMRRPME